MIRSVVLASLFCVTLGIAWRWGSFVAGGSDSSCYATQAVRWAAVITAPGSASLQPPDVLALSAPWPDAATTFTPTGHVPSRTVSGAYVPICPSGLSILMAPLYLIGGPSLMFAIVPALGALLILATYTLGSRFSRRTGLAAAVLVAACPVFLYQVVQPMSDVPAAAFWMLAVALATGTRPRDGALAGVATSLAVLMRPNLVPLGFAIGLFLLLRPERSAGERCRSGLVYAAWSVPGCLAVAALQQYFYGSPFASGYGDFATMFSSGHVAPNLGRYLTWLAQALTPAIALVILAPLLLPGAVTGLLLALVLINLCLYLPYLVFDDWSYVRFLLPTIPLLLVMLVAVVESAAIRWLRSGYSPPDARLSTRTAVVLAIVTCGLDVWFVQQARVRHAFELRTMEARFARAGRFVAQAVPANALVITDYESGSVPFYSGRRTLAWRALDPAWLDRALLFAHDHRLEPYLLFERWEEPEFRSRFAQSAIGALDWPPMAEVSSQVRVYRVADRDRYRAGQPVATEYVP